MHITEEKIQIVRTKMRWCTFSGATNSSLVELRLINCIFKRSWNIKLRHIPKSQNSIADQKIKYVNNDTSNLFLFVDPPSLVQGILHFENNAFTWVWVFQCNCLVLFFFTKKKIKFWIKLFFSLPAIIFLCLDFFVDLDAIICNYIFKSLL